MKLGRSVVLGCFHHLATHLCTAPLGDPFPLGKKSWEERIQGKAISLACPVSSGSVGMSPLSRSQHPGGHFMEHQGLRGLAGTCQSVTCGDCLVPEDESHYSFLYPQPPAGLEVIPSLTVCVIFGRSWVSPVSLSSPICVIG